MNLLDLTDFQSSFTTSLWHRFRRVVIYYSDLTGGRDLVLDPDFYWIVSIQQIEETYAFHAKGPPGSYMSEVGIMS